MRISIIIILGFLIHLHSHAQDTLKLNTGKSKVVKVIYETPLYVCYKKIKDNDTTQLGKEKMMEKEDVFQIAYLKRADKNGGKPKVVQVYQQDSLEENYLTVNEMQRYINGRQQAYQHYNSLKYGLVGFGGGVLSSYFGPFWGVIPVATYTGFSGFWAFKPFFRVDNDEDLKDEAFLEGYRQVARSKQAKAAIIGAGSGLVAGVTALYFIFK